MSEENSKEDEGNVEVPDTPAEIDAENNEVATPESNTEKTPEKERGD